MRTVAGETEGEPDTLRGMNFAKRRETGTIPVPLSKGNGRQFEEAEDRAEGEIRTDPPGSSFSFFSFSFLSNSVAERGRRR